MSTRTFLSVLLLLVASTAATSQTLLFDRHIGGPGLDEFRRVLPTSDRGYVAVGYRFTGPVDRYDLYLARFDALGDTLWTRTVQGDMFEWGNDATIARDGRILVMLNRSADPTANSYDGRIVAFDSLGRLVGEGDATDASTVAITVTRDGGAVIVANYPDPTLESNVVVIRVDSALHTLWRRSYGGVDADYAGDVIEDSTTGDIFVAGSTYHFERAEYSSYLLRLDRNGDSLWWREYDLDSEDQFYSICPGLNGGFILAGYHTQPATGDNVRLLWVNADGAIQNESVYEGGGDDVARSVERTPDGGVVVSGTWISEEYGDLFLLRLDSMGRTQWQKQYGGSMNEGGGYVTVIPDATGVRYAIAGMTMSSGEGGDAYIVVVGEAASSAVGGLEVAGAISLSASPNPFANSTRIDVAVPPGREGSVEVVDPLGRIVQRVDGLRDRAELMLRPPSPGVYIIRVVCGELVKTLRVVGLR